MISVYKTNIEQPAQAAMMINLLVRHFPTAKINFDLEDCDKILRVKGEHCPVTVQSLIENEDFFCRLLK